MLADSTVCEWCGAWVKPGYKFCLRCKKPLNLPYTRVCSELAEHGLLVEEVMESKSRQQKIFDERKVSKLLDRAFGKVVNYQQVKKKTIGWAKIWRI